MSEGAPGLLPHHGWPGCLCSITLVAESLCVIWFFLRAREIYLIYRGIKVGGDAESWGPLPTTAT